MKKTTIIFDFDGTIADSLALIIEIVNEIADTKGKTNFITPDLVATLRGKPAREVLKILSIPLWRLPFFLWRGKKLFLGKIDSLICFPEMTETLEELKKRGYILGILSSNSKENIELFLKNQNITEFDFVHNENNIFGKSGALNRLMKKRQLKKEDVMYVGDEVRDIDACQKIGLDIISVSWGFNSKEVLEKYKPNYLVAKPKELLDILL